VNDCSPYHKDASLMRNHFTRALAAISLLGLSSFCAQAQEYFEPARGTPERVDLLDAIRPLAEWALAPPIEFVVTELRVSGDVAFVNVTAQRPGGAEIDLATSPLVLRDGETPELVDGPHLQALLRKSGRMWVSVQDSIGATDVWYSAGEFCAIWQSVLPEYCADG
jgi:hypothetical protein